MTMQLEDWLDDLCVRFVVNIPAEELVSLERICFQIEEAQWFYEDFIRPLDPSLPSLSLKPFFQRIVPRCPTLQDWPVDDMSTAFERFLKYKNRVPVRGAILLNDKMDEVLLVKGWKKNGTWSFPRGKINKDEDDLDCAIREAWEETGFDIRAAGLVKDPTRVKFIEKTMRSQNMKLFVFRGVPKDAHFVPQTRKEISKIEWFRLSDLPAEKRKPQHEGTGHHLVLNANKFYVVAPFMHDLNKIINAERRKDHRQSSRLAAPPITVDSIDNEGEQQTWPSINQPIFPMSPLMPSSLPEVSPAIVPDALQNLKQQLNIVPIHHREPQVDTAAKSNALLSLLRNGPPVEMRDDPHTPLDQTTFPTQPRSPERPAQQQHPTVNLQSPPPLFDLHQQMHPAAPPSSALPQLSQHTLSLLEAFKSPTLPQSQPSQPRTNLPPAKQNLLAAFRSSPVPQVPTFASPPPQGTQGNSLLQLLQRTPNVPEPPAQPLADVGVHSVPITPLTAPTQPTSQTSQSVTQTPAPQSSNSLLDLLKGKHSSLTQTPVPHTRPLQGGEARNAQVDVRLPSNVQTEPAELSATSDHESRPQPASKTKTDLMSLLNTAPSQVSQPIESKSRSGTTSATLDRPIDEPHYDAIGRTPTYEDDIRRDPVPGNKTLFDHKTGSVKQLSSIKVSSRPENRNRQPKSPRSARHKQSRSPQRPITPKEAAKPFQPQILKRPQVAETIDKAAILSPPIEEESSEKRSSSTLTRSSGLITGPLSPSLDAPQAVEVMHPAKAPSTFRQPSQPLLSPVYDPQREALLSLLKTPSPKIPTTDPDATPKASFAFAQDQPRLDGIVSPPGTTQLVSPIVDAEYETNTSRSRVSSLASIGNVVAGPRPQIEKRQTAAGDKAFLMQYLKGFANQETASN